MDLSPDIQDKLVNFMASGLVISPWLSGVNDNGRFDPLVFEWLETEVKEYVPSIWTTEGKLRLFGSMPAPDRLPQIAMYETVASTAVFIAHESKGRLEVDETIASEAFRLTIQFIDTYGFADLLEIYMVLTAWENHNAIEYFGGIPEHQFYLGSWHRPWVDYSLGEEILLGVCYGLLQIVVRDNERYIELTEPGRSLLDDMTKLLNETGYFEQRLRLLRISQFDRFDEYENLAQDIWPDSLKMRKSFLDWTQITEGMRVLELGCANGAFTFEGGLAQRIGPSGHVTSIDPSMGMIYRAEESRKKLGVNWVRFQKGVAEKLPFPNDSFDAVVGFAFLHFTNVENALKEMRRVTRPGGIVASLHPIKFEMKSTFFVKWFEPLFGLSKRRKQDPKSFLLDWNEVEQMFESIGYRDIQHEVVKGLSLFHEPDKVVKHYIEGLSLFGEELATLPWKARLDLIAELKVRGKMICNEYTEKTLAIEMPAQRIKARV